MAIDLQVLLAAVALAGLGLGVWLAWLGLRRLVAAEQLVRTFEDQLKALKRDTADLQPYTLQLGERLAAMERRISHLSDRQSQVESQARSGPDYDRAIRMAKAGADPETLSRQCGLGQSEARLVVAIHGTRN